LVHLSADRLKSITGYWGFNFSGYRKFSEIFSGSLSLSSSMSLSEPGDPFFSLILSLDFFLSEVIYFILASTNAGLSSRTNLSASSRGAAFSSSKKHPRGVKTRNFSLLQEALLL
jgi:hypothetical protein